MGLTGYYRKFIKDYGFIAAPLTALLKKDVFQWSPQATLAFTALKVAISTPHVLALPDFSKTFVIECDASGKVLGAVLMQGNRPLTYHSEVLKGRSLHLSTYVKEFLALVKAIRKWRPYLVGKPFIIKTDYQSLKYLLEQRIGTPTQQSWITKLLRNSFSMEYKHGKENKAVDALSRRLEDSNRLEDFNSASFFLISFPCSS